jgi:hypothetical protein
MPFHCMRVWTDYLLRYRAIYGGMRLALPGITVLLTESIDPTFDATDLAGQIVPAGLECPRGSGMDRNRPELRSRHRSPRFHGTARSCFYVRRHRKTAAHFCTTCINGGIRCTLARNVRERATAVPVRDKQPVGPRTPNGDSLLYSATIPGWRVTSVSAKSSSRERCRCRWTSTRAGFAKPAKSQPP